MRQFCRYFYRLAWLETLEFNRVPCTHVKMYDDVVFADRFGYPLTVWEWSIDRIISVPPCSYWIWNRYCQNHSRILPNFLFFVWFDTVEFNRVPCPNDKMYDGVVFADWLRIYVLDSCIDRIISTPSCSYFMWYIYTAQIIAEFCRIYYCLYDMIQLNSTACRVQTTGCTMRQFSLIDCVINWLCLVYVYW